MNRIRLLPTLEVVKFILIFIMLLMFINFNSQIAKQTDSTNGLAKSTNQVVKGQSDILTAIKQVTEDTRITANQQTAIIICMLQVPIEARSTDLQAQCRKQYELTPSSTSETTYSPKSADNSSPKNTTTAQTPQRDNPQTEPVATKPTIIDRVTNPVANLLERIF